MNPYGLFQGFGTMRRQDFEPGAAQARQRQANPRTTGTVSPVGPVNSGPRGRSGSRVRGPMTGPPMPARLVGGGNTDPYGVAPRRGLPAGYAYQERLMSQRADNSRITGATPLAVAPSPARTARMRSSRPPVTERPAAITVPGGTIAADYAVPPGGSPLPSRSPVMPAAAVAARPGAIMAPVGASRNEQLVQAAGNAGLRLVSPQAMAVAAGTPQLPAVSSDGVRRMLSEIGPNRPAMAEAPAIGANIGAGQALSPETAVAAAGGFQAGAAAAAGDRFSGLRPDIAAWARHHQNAAKGLDGKNIVDRFMEKQSAPIPLSGPSTMGFADGRQVTGPLPEVTPPADIPLSGPSTMGFADGRQVTGPLPAAAASSRAQAPAEVIAASGPSVIEDYAQPGGPSSFNGPAFEARNPGLMGRIGQALQSSALQPAADAFSTRDVSPVEQANFIRETYRQHTRPQPAPF